MGKIKAEREYIKQAIEEIEKTIHKVSSVKVKDIRLSPDLKFIDCKVSIKGQPFKMEEYFFEDIIRDAYNLMIKDKEKK